MTARPNRWGPVDRGAGTVLTLGLVAVALVLIAAISLLGRAQAARGAAQTAADLGALAAAQHLAGGLGGAGPGAGAGGASTACGIARSVVTANGAALTGCLLLGDGVVRVSTARAAGGETASASARAGPAPGSGGAGGATEPGGWP